MNVLSTNKEQFRATRSRGIGSSEIGAVLGVDPYCTPYQLWCKKTGRGDEFNGNKYTIAGTRLEKVVVEYFEEATGAKMIPGYEGDVTFFHPDLPHVLATPDRPYHRDGVRGILECKTTQRNIDPDFLPESWFCQAQYQAAVLNATPDDTLVEEISIAWLFRGLDFHYHTFEYDPAFGAYLIEQADKFWREHVIADVPPEAATASDVEKAHGRHTAGKVIQATDELLQEWEKLVAVRDRIKILEAERDEIIERFKLIMKDAEAVQYYEETLVTWRNSKPVVRLDSKALKAEMPDVWQKYAKENAPTRPFLVKI